MNYVYNNMETKKYNKNTENGLIKIEIDDLTPCLIRTKE